ncbi:hypothetical protein C2U54_02490 [Leclercia sp. LSNIH1]|nr:hypothetical protein C2U54_02490 [Leclercia sp. LSNIH1]POV31762.1 hypothetical protein C3388_25330 [Leclercia sp. LSNIH5]POW58663.1 hypothetical protein C3389_25330 [Leclercia sp. LSNIH2]HCH39800.1 hypothetical protein [Enterobacter sp.]
MTLILIRSLIKGQLRHYLSISDGISAERTKKEQSEEKIEKMLVLKTGIPIMRLHRHGGCESLHTDSRAG